MPIYVYHCPLCDAVCERIVGFADADRQRCEAKTKRDDAEDVCGGELQREEVSLTSCMKDQWRP